MTTAFIITLNEPHEGNPFKVVIWKAPKDAPITDTRTKSTAKFFPTMEQAEGYAYKYRLNSCRYLDLRG